MAGIKSSKEQKANTLPAFTIVEVVMAMIIITISFGAFVSLFNAVSVNENRSAITQANILLQNELNIAKQNKDFTPWTKEISGLIVEKEFKAYPEYLDTYQISLNAYFPRNRELIFSLKEIVYDR